MSDWPKVLTEDETLDHMCGGASIARFGDGEFKIALGGGTTTHKANFVLAKEFRRILKDPPEGMLVCIPTMRPDMVNYDNWARSKARYAKLLNMGAVYGSAFVGRPTTAPWIARRDYVERFRAVWSRGHIAVVAPGDHSISKVMHGAAEHVTYVDCPKLESYDVIDDIEKRCIKINPDLVVACAGPMATALAARLHVKGIQAIDLGRGAGFLLKWKDEG